MNVKKFKEATSYSISRSDYTHGQIEGIERILKWFHSPKMEPFTLSGFAGTGKTTVTRDIVKNINAKVAVTAPTHKAVRVASEAIGAEGSTIQSLLGLRPNLDLQDFDINNPQFDPLGTVYVSIYKMIIVDECSMIGDKNKKGVIGKGLFSLLIKTTKKHNCKLLFVGDPYQLPPIGESHSRTFDVPFKHNLTEIVRQELDNSLIKLLEIARTSVVRHNHGIVSFLEKRKSNISPDGKGFAIVGKQHFAQLLDDRFDSSDFESNIDYCRYCSFTNESVYNANMYVRKKLFGEQRVLMSDDLLTSYSTIVNEFNDLIIINSEDYIIYEIFDYNNRYMISGFLVKLKQINGGSITNDLFVLDHTIQDNVDRYIQIFYSLLGTAVKSTNPIKRREAWDKFYEFKNYNLLMSDIYSSDGKKVATKDLDYGFGLTIHKTQGSTFDNIFINAKDVIYNRSGIPYANINLRNRLLYVGLSRASDSSFILY